MVFAGFYPVDSERLSAAAGRARTLQLNDASLTYEPESSLRSASASAAVSSACCTWRSSRSGSSANTISTCSRPRRASNTRCHCTAATMLMIDNPADLPSRARSTKSASRGCTSRSFCPRATSARSWSWSRGRRGDYHEMIYLDEDRVQLKFDMPLAELIVDFYDQLKVRTQGYASLDYSFARDAARRSGQAATCS